MYSTRGALTQMFSPYMYMSSSSSSEALYILCHTLFHRCTIAVSRKRTRIYIDMLHKV